CTPIMQRAAAEGRKARAEDHTGVDVVGIRYDVVFKRALGLVEHRLHQFAAKTLEFSRVIADLLALRLALIPHVKSFAGFLAKLALPHETRQHIVGVGSETKLFSHVIRDVEADQVHQLERPHRHAEFQCGLIDLLARLAELIAAHGFHQVGREHAVDEESRAALYHEWQFVDRGDEGARLAHFLVASPLAVHYLDHRKLRHGVEKVHPNQPTGIGKGLSNILEPKR